MRVLLMLSVMVGLAAYAFAFGLLGADTMIEILRDTTIVLVVLGFLVLGKALAS